ncbi:MAG: efflux RND transporter periplasmic adaptor subunit [Kofleriaceae bacterium]
MTRRALVGLAIVVMLVACRERQRASSNELTPEPLAELSKTNVDPVSEQPAGFIGVLTPKAQAEVVAPFATTVKELTVPLGEHVDEGTTLAILDDAPIRELLARSAADLKGAQASQAAAASAAATQRKALRAGVASKASVTAAEYQLSEASARVQGAKAAHEANKSKLSKTTLVAPIAGKVALHYAKVGAQVGDGAPVVRVISSGELFVRFAIPTDQGDKVAVGAVLDIRIDTQGQEVTTRGVITTIAPELDPIARMILAEAELHDPPATLQSGLVCRINIAKPPK